MQISYQSFPNSPPTANMSKVQSPILTPQLTPSVTGYINTKLWDERPAKYAANVLKHVCIFLLILTACEEVTSFAIGQSLKNFFQKLGWSNKGSTSMKLTYDSFSQFMCIVAGYIADERLGKFKTLLSAATLDSFGLLFLVIAALPVIVNNHLGVSKAIFNIGLFLGVAVSQICLRSLVISYGGDQFSPNSPPSEKALFFSIQYWVANIGAFIGYAVFPSVSIHGFGAIPAEYGYVSVYLVGFVMLVIFVGLLWYTRRRYVDVPPTKESIALVIKIVINHAKKNFSAQMVVLGTVLYIAAFLLNILASILSDHGEVGHNISYACGVMIVIATILWVYFGQSSEFMESAKDTVGGHFDSELVDGVKQVIRILPFNAFNVFWWVCQNQRGNNQSIVQQTDTRLGSGPFATQMPGPTVQMFNPIGVLIFVPLMERVIYPLYEKHAGKPASRYGKVLAGYCTAVVAMIWTGCYEIIRRSTSPLTYVDSNGVTQFMINDDGNQVMNDIPWWTAIPQYLLVALAGVMIAIPSYDINYSEVPQSMRSTSIALGFFVNSMGSTLLSIIVLLFGKYIPANLNNGNIEYMFFTLAAIMVVNIFFYVIVMNKMQLGMIPRVKKTGEKTDEAQPGTVLTTGFQGIMAWVNRTTRDNCPGGLQVKAGTSAYVGPGYYETSQSRHVRPNATGFGSGEKLVRGENAGSTKGLTMVTPGPGTYTTNNQTSWQSPTKSKASATSIFQSKSQRLDEIKLRRGYSTPGPGAYTKQDSFTKKAKTHTSLGNPLVRTPPSNNKIRWTRLPTAPSIPTVSQSFGYEQGAYGKLIRHEPTKVGHTGCGNDTLGPGEYEPMKGLKSINKTRTTDFSKGKVTRFIEHEVRSKADVPGPGEYTNTGDATALKDPKRISAVFKSLTREQAAPTTTKNVPGPGAYHPNQSHGFTTETKPEHLQFFGSTLTRFEATQRDALVPGPGAYYYAPGNSQQPRSVPSRKKAPFSSKKERFEAPKEKDQCLAAPGSYEVPSAVSEVLNKVTSRVTNFGSTTRRFDTISSGVPYSRESLESQLERDMKAQEAESQKQGQSSKKRQQPKASSMFASSTSRPHQTQKATGPSPGDYEIRRSWNAAGAQGAFKSGIDRMKDKPNPTAFVPGPGSYSTDRLEQKSHHKARPNVFYAAEPRFKDKLPKVPVLGPGQYNTETIESDWNRPTHNISIATEMEFAMMH